MASLSSRLKYHHLKLHHHHQQQYLLTFSHFYSSSSSSNNDGNNNDGNAPKTPSLPWSDIKSKLTQHQQQRSSSLPNSASIAEIRKNLSEFRMRSSDSTPPNPAASPPPNPTASPPPRSISLQGLYNKNAANPNPKALSFDSIRESLRNLRAANQKKTVNVPTGKVRDKENVSGKEPLPGSRGGVGGGGGVIGGSMENLPKEMFWKEISKSEKFTLTRPYKYAELGMNLKELRPDSSKKKKVTGKDNEEDWFSLSELQQRIEKLREIEFNKSDKPGAALRATIQSLQLQSDKDEKHYRRINILDQPGLMQSSPPKEHLVEKYFHPDNMSAAEKLKLKLKAVRDEFKMSESDCGSTRVQIAQLTTEIIHLSSVLHKKDKHSRRGLQLKVQRRKKLLKYLRRTDWDSYCFVLDKLGLRDNPDYKN